MNSLSANATRSRASGSALVCGALLLCIGQLGMLNHYVPIASLFSAQVFAGGSYERHFGQTLRLANARARWGESWLYDVQLDAGQPEGTLSNFDGKAWAFWVFQCGRAGVPASVAFNSFALLIMWLSPWIIFAVARNFQLSRGTSLVATALAVALWFFDSYLHWAWLTGMVSWCGAAVLALLALSLFQRCLSQPRRTLSVACAGAVALALWLHPGALITLAGPMLATYLRSPRPHPTARVALFGMLCLALSINCYGWWPAWQHRQFFAVPAASEPAVANALLCDLVNLRCDGANTGGLGTRSGLRSACLLMALAWLWLRQRAGKRSQPALGWGIGLGYGTAYVGASFAALSPYQLYQQLIPAALLSTVPAAAFLRELVAQRFVAALPASPAPLRVGVLVAACALGQQYLSGEVAYFLPELAPEPKISPEGTRSLLSQFGFLWIPGVPNAPRFGIARSAAAYPPLTSWLQAHAQPGARILVDDAAIGEGLARSDHFEILGGECRRWLQHVAACYPLARERSLAAPSQHLIQHLQRFAVEWVIGAAPALRTSSAILHYEATVAGFHIARPTFSVNRVLQGHGSVRAAANRLEVRSSEPAASLILSYHWHPALRCRPDCRVERESGTAWSGPDQVGFIRIPAPHAANLTVWNSYQVR